MRDEHETPDGSEETAKPADGSDRRESVSSSGRGKEQRSSGSVLWEVMITMAAVTAVLSVLYHLGFVIPWLKQNLGGLAAVIFVYAAAIRIWRADEDLSSYGITPRPVGVNLAWGLGSAAVVLTIFLVAYVSYYSTVCASDASLLGPLGRDCSRYVGSWTEVEWSWPEGFWEVALAEVLVVAIPEEIFFRGYVQGRLDRIWRSRVRLLGVEVGWSLPAQAVLFGLGHFLVDFNPLRLAVALPALAFGFLRAGAGSVAAPALFHAACNIFVAAIDHNFFPPS